MPHLELVTVDPDDMDARRLERRLLDDLTARYAEDHLDLRPAPADRYRPPTGVFLVARQDGSAVGCAGLHVIDDGVGELTRLWVEPSARRSGIARALTEHREVIARSWGLRRLLLETGHNQPEQLAHAASNGYLPTTPWDTDLPFDARVSYLGKDL